MRFGRARIRLRCPTFPRGGVWRRAALLLMVTGTPAADTAHAEPQRIVSINLCADQYLLALADRRQIAALTHLAADPAMSALARKATGVPTTRGSAEEVIRLEPDLVLAGTFTRRETRGLLRRLDYPVVEIAPARRFADIRGTTRKLARLLGHARRGERLVAELDRRLAAIDAALPEHAPTALYYQRRGFANGADSLVSEIMRAAGLRNLAADLGLRDTGRVELERVIRARPDYLILDSVRPPLQDQGSYLLRHPALRALVPPERRLALPRSMVICGGPMTVEAIDHLAAAVAARGGGERAAASARVISP